MSLGNIKFRPYNKQKRTSESNEGEFLWLISLSDLMMLLFVFFVVLFSFASKKLSGEDYYRIKKVFNTQKGELNTPMDEVQASLLKWVTDRNLLESVRVVRKEDALILEIKEKLLFAAGESALRLEASAVLPVLREALAKIPNPYRVGIEGHTDDTPVAGASDNWHLSVERALAVSEALKLPPALESRLVIMGFGSTRPLLPNRDSEGNAIASNQAQNRRVTIRIF